MADCQSRGQRLANIYNENEQTELNALIIDIGGSDRAFWLGMIEDGETPDKFGIKVKFYGLHVTLLHLLHQSVNRDAV